MDKSKLASIGERLKSGGAQMGRLVSLKVREMKDLLQAPTPESKIVDQATSPNLESPDWGLNLRICSLINGEELNGTEIVRAIKRKISGNDVMSQKLGLELLEACAMNCEKVFSEIASEKLLEEMVRVIESNEAERECRVRAMEMIRAWGESEDLNYLPVFRQTYVNLQQRGMASQVQDGTLPPIHYSSFESYIDQEPLSPPENYPIPETELNGDSGTHLPYNYARLSIEEKKEFLEITRNSAEVLSSLLTSAVQPDLTKDDLMVSMLEKCKESQPVLQRLVESTTDDESLLFEALNLHDELQQVISKCEKMQVSEKSEEQPGSKSGNLMDTCSPPQSETQNPDILTDSLKLEHAGTSASEPTTATGESSSDK